MNKSLRYFLIIFTTAVSLAVHAQPSNVMVGDLTFTPPKDWEWESPSNSVAAARSTIRSHDRRITTDVRLYFTGMDAASAEKLWRSYFPDSNKPGGFKEEHLTVGKRDIVYMTLNGTYAYKSERRKPGYTWVGAVIPSGQKYILPRILGPKAEVEASLKDFKRMVENAIKEGENKR